MGLSGVEALAKHEEQTSHQLHCKEVEHDQRGTFGDSEGECLQDIRQIPHDTCHQTECHTEDTDAKGYDRHQTVAEGRREQMTCSR